MSEPNDNKGGSGSSSTEIEATVERLLNSKGDRQAVAELLKDNFKQRDEIRGYLAQIDEVKSKVPAEGTMVLTAEQAKDWTAYQELGKPEDLKAKVEKVSTLEADLAKRDREAAIASAAEAAGYKASVLAKLPGTEALKFELREEEVDGEKKKIAYVTGSGDGATPQKLSDYAEREWADFVPALTAEAAASTPATAGSGTPFRGQSGQAKPPKGTQPKQVVENRLKNRYAVPGQETKK